MSPVLDFFESPPQMFNLLLHHKLPICLSIESRYSYELITLVFPGHLLPTEDEGIAQNFFELETFLGHVTITVSSDPPGDQDGDLKRYRKAWVSDQSSESRTHLILLGWKSTECELRFKDPTAESKYRLAPKGSNDYYQRSFLDPLQKMIDMGIQMTSIHLRLEATRPLWILPED